ncbi:hypothetical protein HXP39_19835, partial [Vibrio cholerae O1 biovar El Tor]|nr:hypothetical protein [Vibrio cholerae O1 biovar El Tor]
MKISVDTDSVFNAVDQLRVISKSLANNQRISQRTSLSGFSTAGGLDEAGERLSPIGDERAPEANQAIALYLK